MKTNEPIVGSNASPISVRKFSVKEVLVALIFFLVLFIFLPLEYDNIKAKAIIYPVMWISMGYIVFKAFPGKSLTKSSLLIILGVICLSYTFSHVIGFCGWIKHGTLYKNKRDKSIRIICRTYECFGTAEGCQLFEERRITEHIKWVTSFDEKPIDTTKWQSVPFMSSE
ncbi:hypothetical protein A3860_32875 [Niastella vici]|uniref:Uncharacterized protein n=1 Tax=Niastella vici TaxID=1703345 RepID=A0A1V9FQJ8_9BACT|nr:hypothetical protein [Niastella vici]OQP60610.1 hypothetical protein A3860_32875 [Niastella vici]